MKKSVISTLVSAVIFIAGGCCADKAEASAAPEVKTSENSARNGAVQNVPVKKAAPVVFEAEKNIRTPKGSPAHQVTIHLVGDSTCAFYPAKRAPLVGWGQVLKDFCKAGVRVNNQAYSGFSSRSYIESKRWERLMNVVKPGDYVVIQFGHNDGKKDKRYADAKVAYPANLKKFITDVRARQCNPIIATSISRCVFKKGKIASSGLDRYRDAAIAVANAENVPVIDLKKITADKFNAMGEKEAFSYFRGNYQTAPREAAVKVKPIAQSITPAQIAIANNNSPAAAERLIRPRRLTQVDRTHLVKAGADKVAGWFVAECKAKDLPIAKYFK